MLQCKDSEKFEKMLKNLKEIVNSTLSKLLLGLVVLADFLPHNLRAQKGRTPLGGGKSGRPCFQDLLCILLETFEVGYQEEAVPCALRAWLSFD